MGKEARTILNKKHAMALIENNFKLLDVQVSKKYEGEVAFIFEKTEALEEEFNILVNAERILKPMYGLTFKDIRTLIGVLQGYSIEDTERYPIMEKLQVIEDMVTGYKAPAISDEMVNAETDVEVVADKLAESTADKLKQVMNGCK